MMGQPGLYESITDWTTKPFRGEAMGFVDWFLFTFMLTCFAYLQWQIVKKLAGE